MRHRAQFLIPTALLLAVALSACGGAPGYAIDPPTAFKQYDDDDAFKFITADGVRLKAREVENYPKADLPFWTDAMQRHLQKRGYVAKGEKHCFRTQAGLPGCTLEFLLPRGAEDWVLSETVFVVDDRIILVEAAGPFDRYTRIEKDLRHALTTFEPGKK